MQPTQPTLLYQSSGNHKSRHISSGKTKQGKKDGEVEKNYEVPAELGVKSVQYVIQTVKESGSDGPNDCLHPGNS